MVDLVRKHPGVAIPVVLPRLMQKEEEWYAQTSNPHLICQLAREAVCASALRHLHSRLF